jgi:tight adherence protein B
MFQNLFNRGGTDDRLEDINNLDNFDMFMDGYEDADEPQQDANTALDDARSLLEPLNRALGEGRRGQAMRGQLERANVKLTVAEYYVSHIAASAGIFTLAFLFFARGDLVFSTIAGVVGFFVPRFMVNRMINQRLHAFESQLPDTLSLWVNALRSGFSVMQAMEAIAKDAPEPTMTEFRRVVKEVQLGIDMEDALEHLLNRIQSEDLDLVVTAVNIQREVGGNLAEILEVISHTIRERIKLKGEIRVLTSQGRITGYLISFLPISLAFFLNFASPGYMGPMFSDRRCGWPMMGVGLALIGIGTAVIQKIVDIEI